MAASGKASPVRGDYRLQRDVHALYVSSFILIRAASKNMPDTPQESIRPIRTVLQASGDACNKVRC